VIADALQSAIRVEQLVAEKTNCMREPSFVELYKHVGDQAAQDRIRQVAGEEHHCYILCGCPTACDELPEGFGEVQKGDPCPNNPYHRHADHYDEYYDALGMLEQAHQLRHQAQLGIMPGLDQLSTGEYVVACMMRDYSRDLDLRRLRGTVIEAMAMMWGSGREADDGH
jgi:hypothetical protein